MRIPLPSLPPLSSIFVTLCRGRYPHVPAAVDFVSTDDYTDMTAVKNARWFYNKFLYPKCGSDMRRIRVSLHPHTADASPYNPSLAGSSPTIASC